MTNKTEANNNSDVSSVQPNTLQILKTRALSNGLSIELCRNTSVFSPMLELRIATADGQIIGSHRLSDIEKVFSRAVDKYSCLSQEQIEQASSLLTTRKMRNGLKIEAYKDNPESAHSFRVRVVTSDGIALDDTSNTSAGSIPSLTRRFARKYSKLTPEQIEELVRSSFDRYKSDCLH